MRDSDVILRCDNLGRRFKTGETTLQILHDVDLTVRRGEFIAIEGRSGSGKSTLLHLLAGLDTPQTGSVAFEGQDLAAWARASENRLGNLDHLWGPIAAVLRTVAFPVLLASDREGKRLSRVRNRSFGFVFQFYYLLPELDVLENTLLASMVQFGWLDYRRKRAELRERAAALLGRLGLGHRLRHRSSQLSGGERQRVAIARALMNEPAVLFADEPTGNLDYETGRQIMEVLEKLHHEQSQTILMVTHDRALARTADRVLVLQEGRLQPVAD